MSLHDVDGKLPGVVSVVQSKAGMEYRSRRMTSPGLIARIVATAAACGICYCPVFELIYVCQFLWFCHTYFLKYDRLQILAAAI